MPISAGLRIATGEIPGQALGTSQPLAATPDSAPIDRYIGR
jgi:hypothetical protein